MVSGTNPAACAAASSSNGAGMLVRQLGLVRLVDQRADRLSGGETVRMALARSFMRRYDLVILDGPAALLPRPGSFSDKFFS